MSLVQSKATWAATRVFGYARVSTTEEADEGASLSAQQQQIAGYAMMKGWQVAEHFVERGVSGSTPLAERPEGSRMLATVGKGDIIVTAKLDRAFRSAADVLAVLEEFKVQGVGLHMIDLGGDVTSNGISKMVFTILAAVAEGERDRIRERIRDAKPHLMSQGVFSGGKGPFRYDIVLDGETSRMVPKAAEMAIIGRMKAMRQEARHTGRSAPLRDTARNQCSGFWSAWSALHKSASARPSAAAVGTFAPQ